MQDVERGADGSGPSATPLPDRRRVLTAGAAGATGIFTLTLPAASAAATGQVAPASVGTLSFSDVTETGFTVSWGGAT